MYMSRTSWSMRQHHSMHVSGARGEQIQRHKRELRGFGTSSESNGRHQTGAKHRRQPQQTCVQAHVPQNFSVAQ